MEGGRDIKKYNIAVDGRCMFDKDIIDEVLKARGIKYKENFLNPDKNHLLDNIPYTSHAIAVIEKGIKEGKRFTVFFDCDLDGMSSGAIMYRYLKYCGAEVNHIYNTGKIHGLGGQNLDELDCDILVIVDSIDNDFSLYKAVLDNGVQNIVILDHHEIDNIDNFILNDNIVLVSSNNQYLNPHLSGSGVVWKVVRAMDKDFADSVVDLATCGIIGDMMDVSDRSLENRYICSLGFEKKNNPAIQKIVGNYEFNAKSVIWSIAPLINSLCRYGENEAAARLFISDDKKEIKAILEQGDICKTRQRAEVNEIVERLIPNIDNSKPIIFAKLDVETELTGLIANKLLEFYSRPIFICKERDTHWRGSCRAIGVENFKNICSGTKLCTTAGHQSAFGFEVHKAVFEKFQETMWKDFADWKFETAQTVDLYLDSDQCTPSLIEEIQKINLITGQGFEPITVAVKIDHYNAEAFGKEKQHLKVVMDDMEFIKWNDALEIDEIDNSVLDYEITFIGALDMGWSWANGSRVFRRKMIVDDFIREEVL